MSVGFAAKRLQVLAQGFSPVLYAQGDLSSEVAYREAVRDHSPGLLGLGFCHKELALKGRPNAMDFRHGSQGIHFHPCQSVALSGRIPMELSQA